MDTWHIAHGYRFAGVHCGIRPDPDRLDLALIVSDRPARAAGVFTQNRVCAAPVRVCRERLPRDDARGIVICSGNANACTGEPGLSDARRMTQELANGLGCRAEQVLAASTGVIGRPLPMNVVVPGIGKAIDNLGDGSAFLDRAAHAILTTDTRTKVSTRAFSIQGNEIRITGFAKGAAMIGPNMATLLAFVMTDAAVSKTELARIAKEAAENSFNSMSVEGHTSTNDSLILLANGAGSILHGRALQEFHQAATEVCGELAKAIAADAEGASHLITIHVEGTRTPAEAKRIAQTIANSALVKTAFFGADPNWGRIVSAAGYAGVAFEESQLSLWLGDHLLYDRGAPQPFDAGEVSSFIKEHREITVRLVLALGSARCTFHTCDLTYEYVRLNADYTT